MRDRLGASLLFTGLLALALAATASDLPRLPDDRALPQSGDSPGQVVFSHKTHLEVGGSCLDCHSKLFSILGRSGSRRDSGIRHSAMDKGRYCGACHDGVKASGLDDCTHCHRE